MISYRSTIRACFMGSASQAVVNTFIPLLFLTFQRSYGIPLTKITLLITVNFALQLVIDLLSVTFVDRIGYRASAVLAHICTALGLASLTVLPEIMDPFTGILIAIMIYAVGGGLLEVLISPIVDACPSDNKEKAMSLLHSFYYWGCLAVIIVSTAFFSVFGTSNWKILALVWALLPLLNAFQFMRVPLASLLPEGDKGMRIPELFRNKTFWLMMLLMLTAGACEQAVCQWASTFAEMELGVTKAVGDLAGPAFFSLLMGLARAFYGKFGEKIDLKRFMLFSTGLCVVSYLMISLSPWPALSLIGCGLCGLSVGILWPGTFSTASAAIRRGGTALFALLALAGDLGCSGGPTFVGFVAGAAGDNLKLGILAAVIFPVVMCVGVLRLKKTSRGQAAAALKSEARE